MISQVLNKTTKTVPFAAAILALSSLFSLILGLIRNNLLSTSFAKEQTDIFFAAFRIPDLVYGILITGGITAAFLPVFSSYYRKNKEQALHLTNNVLSVFFLSLAVLSFILAVFSPYLVKFLVPGFSLSQQETTAQLMRIMFLSPVLLGVSAIFSAILQYFNLFFAYGLAPILYNVGIIFGILFFYPSMGIKGLGWGVILGAFLHLIIQAIPALCQGLRPKIVFDLKFHGLKKIFQLMAPRSLGSAAYHINLIIITAIASTISSGAVSIFYYSNYIYGVPVSLVGISFATAVFPTLSKNFADKEKGKFLENFNATFRHLAFFAIPFGFLFFVLRAQIVRLVYGASLSGGSYFGWWATRLTSASVGILALSIFSACLIPFLSRVFFSFHDTKTPVKVALLSIVVNIISAYFFVWVLGFNNFFQRWIESILRISAIENSSVVGLALSITLATLLQLGLLLAFLKKKIAGFNLKYLLGVVWRLSFASILMALAVWVSLRFFTFYFSTQNVIGILVQTILGGAVGMIVYCLVVFVLMPGEIKNILSLLLRMLQWKTKPNQVPIVHLEKKGPS